MGIKEILGIAIVAFLIEEPIAQAILKGICEQSYFFCEFGKIIILIVTLSILYLIYSKVKYLVRNP